MEKSTNLKGIILIECTKEEIINRVIKRKELENRIDDDLSILEKRIDGYFKETIPVIEELNKQNDLLIIKGNQKMEKVNKDIKNSLRYLL